MCSPARDLSAGYHAVSEDVSLENFIFDLFPVGTFNGCRPSVSLIFYCTYVLGFLPHAKSAGRSLLKQVSMRMLSMRRSVGYLFFVDLALLIVSSFSRIDPTIFNEARKGIPVSTQRRFDVYPDVGKDFV